MDLDINWPAVIAATVAQQALGALWYGVIFRNTWMRAMDMKPEEIEREGPGPEMAIGVLASLVSAIALAVIMTLYDDPTVADGVTLGAVSGIGFVTAATFMNGVYEQKKPILSGMFGAYQTLALMIAGAILGAWK